MSTTVQDQLEVLKSKNFSKTLQGLTILRTAKETSKIENALELAYENCKENDALLLFARILIHIGDISRHHNILKELGINSKSGGAQERKTFRIALKWLSNKNPNLFRHLLSNRLLNEYSVYDSLWWYKNTTERFTGRLVETEVSLLDTEAVQTFLAAQIGAEKDIELIAKHLPKYPSGNTRTAKVRMKKSGKFDFKGKENTKLNGKSVDSQVIDVNKGDIVSFQRKKQPFTLKKDKEIREWISSFIKKVGWDLSHYKEFKKLQNTTEQAVSSRSVLKMDKMEFLKFMERMPSSAMFRFARTVTTKDSNKKIIPDPKWKHLGEWYIEWENAQKKAASDLREAKEKEIQ